MMWGQGRHQKEGCEPPLPLLVYPRGRARREARREEPEGRPGTSSHTGRARRGAWTLPCLCKDLLCETHRFHQCSNVFQQTPNGSPQCSSTFLTKVFKCPATPMTVPIRVQQKTIYGLPLPNCDRHLNRVIAECAYVR